MAEQEKQKVHKNKVVQRLGEWIFPQKIEHLVGMYGEQELLYAINAGLIEKSKSKAGASVQGMKKKAKYVELTEKGWKEFNEANWVNSETADERSVATDAQ